MKGHRREIEYRGKKHETVKQLAEEYGINPSTLYARTHYNQGDVAYTMDLLLESREKRRIAKEGEKK
jgi:transposase-like protein